MKKHSFIFIALATLTSVLLTSCGGASSRESVQADFVRFTSQLSDHSYVDWEEFDKISTEQYTADWEESIQQILDSTEFPIEKATALWATLRNAKALVHKESLALRSFLTEDAMGAIDSLETGFDKVFLKIISQEYYMRVFPDCFDEVIPPLLDKMVKKLAEDYTMSSTMAQP